MKIKNVFYYTQGYSWAPPWAAAARRAAALHTRPPPPWVVASPPGRRHAGAPRRQAIGPAFSSAMVEMAMNTVVALVPLVIAALEGVEVNKQVFRLLALQWERLQPTLPTLRGAKNFGQSHMNALGALERLGRDTIGFIVKFNRKGFFNKGWNHVT